MRIRIRKGLDIPISGEPEQKIGEANPVTTVAVLGPDVTGLRPGIEVGIGDRVRLGQTLFIDKRNPRVRFTSPGAGIVSAINRGEKRVLQSIVIELDGDEAETFSATASAGLAALDTGAARETLLASGLWTAFRTRPFERIPAPEDEPAAIFVTAIDTNPLAANPDVIVCGEEADAFADGLAVLARLTEGYVYLCVAPDSRIPSPDGERFRRAEFAGPHPAGLVGTHMHFLDPVGERRRAWHVGYQDVIAIGKLMTRGRLPVERVVSLGGPLARNPRLLRTRVGASTRELIRDELEPARARVISGSILSGHRAAGPLAWLGRYHNQVSVLREGSPREFLAWMMPGLHKFSSERAYVSHLVHRGGYGLTTSQNGSPRAMVSVGSFEKVMPLDILPTSLLKALLVRDTDRARDLGCLELAEEDLALCSFVCNGKYEYGPFLRMCLDEIEANG